MKKEYPFRLFGIFGFPLGHTLSPVMQEAAFEKLGIKAYYLPFELRPTDFTKVMKGIRRLLLDGFNVTVPYKATVIPFLDGWTSEARVIGAVNTVFRKGGKWWGANTDWEGFLRSLKQDGGFSPRGKIVLLLGAGGSARAVAYALAREKAASIRILNRHRRRAEELAGDFRKIFPRIRFEVVSAPHPYPLPPRGRGEGEGAISLDVDLVVNATSVGLRKGDPLLISRSMIPNATPRRRIIFFDLVYRPAETPFLRAARLKGHRAINGTGMLVHQGVRAFEYWTGRKAPIGAMRRVLEKAMKEKPEGVRPRSDGV